MGAGCRFSVVTDGERTFEIRPCSESALMIKLEPAQGDFDVSKILNEPDTAPVLMPVVAFFSEKPHLLLKDV